VGIATLAVVPAELAVAVVGDTGCPQPTGVSFLDVCEKILACVHPGIVSRVGNFVNRQGQ